MTDTVTVLKALADETRLRILNLLWEGRDLCLCEIEAVLRLTQSNASRHLSRLREAGLINTEKRGQWTHFHLVSGNVSDHRSAADDLLRLALQAARDSMDVLAADRSALQAYRSSPYRCETIRTWREVYWSAPDH